ncbi:MAG: type II toxin-antitoxin system PemK/MazF family toxin [Coriobacteriia bacterium]|nr:type II toxin-antitoxin system PemK/MazF family toxin [Coriobacteriia bacterium]
MARRYIPCKGDLIALTFDPQTGHEQQGRRPALVVSNDLFNERTGLCIVCPVTRTDRGHPFHVRIPDGEPVEGCVMVEQMKSVDYRARGARRIGVAPRSVLDEALALIDACLY